MRGSRWVVCLLTVSWLLLLGAGPMLAQAERTVYVLTVDGAITAAVEDYIERGIQRAERGGGEALVIQLNTPGGDVQSMTGIMEHIENAAVPVIIYVWPRGGMAASAGTLVLLAAHGAAMAPRTSIGAAHPVAVGGEMSPEQTEKLVNVMVEHAGVFARRRGEAAVEWAEQAIRESATAGPEKALELGVIDLIACDLDELLSGFDRRQVVLGDGTQMTLHTAGATAQEIRMSLIEQLLQVLIDPNIAFILLAIGIQAILIEISAPGGWVAGFIGVLCLALAAYSFGVLPFNWLGMLLIVVAFVLFVIDVKAPTHGALTAAGVGTLIAGALVLFNTFPGSPYGRISIPLVVTIALLTGLFFLFVVAKTLRVQQRPSVTGKEGLIGRTGVVKVALDPEGTVLVAGERWRAMAETGPVEVGTEVEVVAADGFQLRVRPK